MRMFDELGIIPDPDDDAEISELRDLLARGS
jgi:hypothetical protein